MSFFKGQEVFSIDNKGRVNIPAKMRKALSPEANDTFIITRGADKCVVAYPLNEWKKYEEQYAKLDQFDEKNRFFLRVILAWSEETEIDAQQRISLSKKYLDFAGIEGKVTIVGMIDHIEFWNPEEFDRYISTYSESYEDVAAQVMKK
ncbi:MAG: division/cell wall cluster transcriptional repressor MraZ [Candidatus Kapaibacterium sp.]